MTLDLDHLKKLAMAATPFEWRLNGDTILSNQSHPIATLSASVHRQCWHGTGKDGEFISTFCPATVLELIRLAEKGKRMESAATRTTMCPKCHRTVLLGNYWSGQCTCGVCFFEYVQPEKPVEPMPTTDDVPIEKRGVLCWDCGKVVPEGESEAHCAGHAGDVAA